MSKPRSARSILMLLAMASFLLGQPRKSREWLTWGGDPQRSGWNRGETAISSKNVERFELKWKTPVDNPPPVAIESGNSMLTAPLVAENVRTSRGSKTLVYTLSWSGTLAAIDASDGSIVWQRTFPNKVNPARQGNWPSCTNTPTATPAIDKPKGILYLLTADGSLRGVSLRDGEDLVSPVGFVPPFSRNWSMNLVDGVIYTTVGRGCGIGESGPVASQVIAIDLNDPERRISRFLTSAGRPAGGWSRAGVTWGHNAVMVQTADGAWDPATGKWGQTLLQLAPATLQLQDYFTPPNLEELNAKDLDYASGGPVAFTHNKRTLVASAGKDATLYLLDSKQLGGEDHRTPLFSLKIGNDEMWYASHGVWGALTTALDAKNERWIYVPMWGPPSREVKFPLSHGPAQEGSIMAFKIVTAKDKPVLIPMWISKNVAVPEPPVVANGIVFAIGTGENTLQRHTDPRYPLVFQKPGEAPVSRAGLLTPAERAQNVTHVILHAFDAQTGKELYSSNDLVDDWTHLSSISVGAGSVYFTSRRSILWAFGPRK